MNRGAVRGGCIGSHCAIESADALLLASSGVR